MNLDYWREVAGDVLKCWVSVLVRPTSAQVEGIPTLQIMGVYLQAVGEMRFLILLVGHLGTKDRVVQIIQQMMLPMRLSSLPS